MDPGRSASSERVLSQSLSQLGRAAQPLVLVDRFQGTIEEGMLSVLKFKKSLFAGVLDGGEREVFFGGSRLTRFMETVEKTTAAIAEPLVEEHDEAPVAERDVEVTPRAAAAVASDGWTTLLQTGLSLLEQLAETSRAPHDAQRRRLSFVQRDPETGRDYLKIPMPNPEVLDRTLQAISALLDQFRR